MSAEYNFIDIEKGGRFGLYLFLIYKEDSYLMRGPTVISSDYFHWNVTQQEYDEVTKELFWN